MEFSCQYGHAYEYIFWVDAETAGGCAESYKQIAEVFNLGGRVRDSDGLTILVREYLARLEKRWLIIFDNVESWSSIVRYIPSNLEKSRSSVLITARKRDILPPSIANHGHVPIEALELEDSRRMLLLSLQLDLAQKDLRSHPEYYVATEAVSVIERLPLAIDMVSGFVRASQCSLADFLGLWEERKLLGDIASSPMDTIWDIGIQELPLEARKMLDVLSFLDPGVIQHDLLVGDHTEPALKPLRFLDASQPRRYVCFVSFASSLGVMGLTTLDEIFWSTL